MRLAYELVAEAAPQIGLIVLQSDETLERDMLRLLPAQVDVLVSRVPSGQEVTSDTLAAMAQVLTPAAALLPRGARFAAVGYGCTSGTAEIGAARVAQAVRAGVKTPNVTEPVSALVAACAQMGVRRIGMISPYIASVSERLREVIAPQGVEVVWFASFEEPMEARVARIDPASIAAAAVEIGRDPACDAVFLSCTNLRTLDVIEAVEAEIGKPVLASNTVLAWHLARLAGVQTTAAAFGRLGRCAGQGRG